MVIKNGLKRPVGPASPPYSQGPYEMKQVLIKNKPAVDSFLRYVLKENFHRLPKENATISAAGWDTEASRNSNVDFEVVGTGATEDDITFGTTVGGILLTTDSSPAQEVIVAPHLGLSAAGTAQSAWTKTPWGTENQVIYEAVIRTGASIADTVIWAGLKLTNTATVATDDDAIYFRYDGNVDYWEATSSIDDTDAEVATGVAVAANTNYYFRIEIDKDRKGHFFIDSKEVAISGALTNDIDLIPYIGIQGNAKTMYIVKEKISRIIYE